MNRHSSFWRAIGGLIEFIMEQRMMQGIKQRVEITELGRSEKSRTEAQ